MTAVIANYMNSKELIKPRYCEVENERERDRERERDIVPEDCDPSLDSTLSVFYLQLQPGAVTTGNFPAKYFDQKL